MPTDRGNSHMAAAATAKNTDKSSNQAVQGTDSDNPHKGKMNINTASLDHFRTIPFMTGDRGKLIMNYREAKGPFENINHVVRVTGIGEGLAESIKMHFYAGAKDEPSEMEKEIDANG